MKKKAEKLAKEKMNKFEMKLMSNGECLDALAVQKKPMQAGQKIEIVTDYLYFA